MEFGVGREVAETIRTVRSKFIGIKGKVFLSGQKNKQKFSVPLNVGEPGGVPESFGKRIAVYFQLGYLERKEWAQNLISKVKETESEIVC